MKTKINFTFIALGIVLLASLGFLAYFGIINSVTGVSQNLEIDCENGNGGYFNGCSDDDDFEIDDLKSGSTTVYAYLYSGLPDGTEKLAFNVDYKIDNDYQSSSDTKATVKYEIYNFKTSSWESIESKSWTIKNNNRDSSDLRIVGDEIYNSGVPKNIESILTRYSSSSSNREYKLYLSCLDGMTSDEAKTLYCESSPTSNYCGSDSRRSIQCIYGGQSIVAHEDNDDSDENYDIKYFPKLITVGEDYFGYLTEGEATKYNGDSKVGYNYSDKKNIKLKISISTSGGHDSISDSDFDIEIWNVETTVVDTFSSPNCDYQAKYTYQLAGTDYYTLEECQLSNNLIECYKDEHCEELNESSVDCSDNICVYTEDTIINDIFPEGELKDTIQEISNESGISRESIIISIFIGVFLILILIGIIVAMLLKKK